MSITLTKRDELRLTGVHPNMSRVVRRAAFNATRVFMVLEGVRSDEKMLVNWGKGRTAAMLRAKGFAGTYADPMANKVTWLNNPLSSNHRKRADGFGRAVDLAPVPLDWNDKQAFFDLHLLMMAAAKEEKVHIRWGKDWDEDGRYEEKGESDGPHFELVM